MILYTIGFSGKSAEDFFTRLRNAGVYRILDIRLNPVGQLSGFAKARDLPYFLKTICAIDYSYLPSFAPPAELLDGYRKKEINWPKYAQIYQRTLLERAAESSISIERLGNSCLLCSEDKPIQCHRRLAAEYLSAFHPALAITHL
jgi:uncharacterized protein (DUF488 family)